MSALEERLGKLRSGGRKILAPYLTAGFPSPDVFPELVRSVAAAGADMLEIGIPFTDPLMDGPVIQRASDIALAAETRPATVLRAMASIDLSIPFVFMTYVNPVLQMGWDAFAGAAAESGAAGAIIPDLPPEEGEAWSRAANERGLAAVFLAAPTTPAERIIEIVRLGSGFIYCVSLLGVTGVRESLSDRAQPLVERVRAETDRCALVGLGVSTPEQALEACAFSDGVIVGSAVIKSVEEEGPDAAASLVSGMRKALDG